MEYNEIFRIVIILILGALGAPLTQWLKTTLGLQDGWAVAVTGIVAALVAIAEIFLSGAVGLGDLTLANFPAVFGLVFTAATVYYQLLKGVEGFFGQRFMLKDRSAG